MSIERIPCGGWDIDNTTIAFVKSGNKKVLRVVAGSESDPSKLPLTGGTMTGPIVLEEDARPTESNHVVDKQYVDDSLSAYRIRDLFGVGPNGTQTIVLPDSRGNVVVVFYSIDPEGNVNVSNSKAISVASGGSVTKSSLTVSFGSDGKTITLTNSDDTESILGQYYGYNG